MKRQVLLLTVCGILGVFSVGCGASMEGPPEESQGDGSPDGQVEPLLARSCRTSCTGFKYHGATCEVVGYGSATGLSGCRKACRLANVDAEDKAFISACNLSQCLDSCH
jgi:hypothetical protein